MTEGPRLRVCRWLAAALVAAYCLWQGVSAALPYFGSSDALSYLSDWRSAARSAPEGRLALLCSDARGITPIERSRLVAMTWERAPAPIATVAAKGDLKEVDVVLASRWIPRPAQEWLGEAGFSVSVTNEFVCTWCEAKALGIFVVPIAAVAFLARPFCKPCLAQDAVSAFVPMLFLLASVPLACAFHTSQHSQWMMDNTIPRLLWYISAVPLAVLVQKKST